jgi:hypothetical protein
LMMNPHVWAGFLEENTMQTMLIRKRLYLMSIGLLLCRMPVASLAGEHYRVLSKMNDEIAKRDEPRHSGAPQVLELPPVGSTVTEGATLHGRESIPDDDNVGDANAKRQDAPPVAATKRTYLGLVYTSTEKEDGGVEVLDVLVGSPAAQAGFVGSRTPAPASRTEQIMKLAMAGLIMSPAAPAAVPLVIAHELFLACHPPGDVILAVGDQAIRDAAELNSEIRRYHPGAQVAFSIVRCGKPMQVTAQMGEEAPDLAEGEEESGQPREPELSHRRDGASFTVHPLP